MIIHCSCNQFHGKIADSLIGSPYKFYLPIHCDHQLRHSGEITEFSLTLAKSNILN